MNGNWSPSKPPTAGGVSRGEAGVGVGAVRRQVQPGERTGAAVSFEAVALRLQPLMLTPEAVDLGEQLDVLPVDVEGSRIDAER